MKTLNVDGYIIDDMDRWLYDAFEVPYITLPIVRAFLADAAGDEIELIINSFGGDMWTGAAIYAELRAYAGKSTARIIGLSASASSFAMLGADRVIASPMASIMIHEAQTDASGNRHEMQHTAEILAVMDSTIVNAYEIKTGKTRKELEKYMAAESWFSAQDALELGLIDDIDLKKGERLTATAQSAAMMASAGRVAACFNPARMHAMAATFKPAVELGLAALEQLLPDPVPPIVLPEPDPPAETPIDSGGESRPVSIQDYSELRKKIHTYKED